MHHPMHVLDAPVLTLPGENWSPPGKRPRNSYMTNLDGLCQGGPEGEKYIQKLPGLVKRLKNKQKGSLEESCESLIVGTADGREERREDICQKEGTDSAVVRKSSVISKPVIYHSVLLISPCLPWST